MRISWSRIAPADAAKSTVANLIAWPWMATVSSTISPTDGWRSRPAALSYEAEEPFGMKAKASKIAGPQVSQALELRAQLARKIALYMGSAENRATEIPGLSLHRRVAPTAPCSATYEPGVTVIAQGRKRVDLGRTTFIYGESRYLLTSVDLPIVSQIVEASEKAPCLAMSLKLEMPVIRELLSRNEIQAAEAPSNLTVPRWRPVKSQWNS